MGDVNNSHKSRPATARIVVALVILISTAVLGYWLVARTGKPAPSDRPEPNQPPGSTTALGTVEPAPATEPTEGAGACSLTEADVRNVPEGWTPHVFAGPCVGLAFPAAEKGVAQDLGTGTVRMGDLLRLADDGDPAAAMQALDVQVIGGSEYEGDVYACSSPGPGSYSFCRREIDEKWLHGRDGGLTIFRPKTGLILEGDGTEAVAAASTADGRFIAFDLRNRERVSGALFLEQVLATLTLPGMGSPPPKCGLSASDVGNVPEGWTPVVFPGQCIGLAFPVTERGTAFSSGVSAYGDWDGELLRLSDNADSFQANLSLQMMVIENEMYEGDPSRCSSFGMDGYVYCRNRIMDEWGVIDVGNYAIYRPESGQTEKQFNRKDVAVAAVLAKDGRFVTFFLYKNFDASATQSLDAILKSLALGQRRQ